MNLNYQLIKEKKSKLIYPSDLFINGNYQKSISEKFFDNISPIDGKIINQISFAQRTSELFHESLQRFRALSHNSH